MHKVFGISTALCLLFVNNSVNEVFKVVVHEDRFWQMKCARWEKVLVILDERKDLRSVENWENIISLW